MSIYSKSSYKGDIKSGWYHSGEGDQSIGEFTYPSGVRYVGKFYKGQFHGEGTLIYPNGGQYKGVWNMGKKVSGDYYFYDGLKYETSEWDYCLGQDRRFNYERNNGILPSGQTQLKNDPNASITTPPGTYDTGDGFFDPIRSLVFSYAGDAILRTPDAKEVDWITRTCKYTPRDTREPITGVEDGVVMRVMEMQEEKRQAQSKAEKEPEPAKPVEAEVPPQGQQQEPTPTEVN